MDTFEAMLFSVVCFFLQHQHPELSFRVTGSSTKDLPGCFFFGLSWGDAIDPVFLISLVAFESFCLDNSYFNKAKVTKSSEIDALKRLSILKR
jgi:hypothetical protein